MGMCTTFFQHPIDDAGIDGFGGKLRGPQFMACVHQLVGNVLAQHLAEGALSLQALLQKWVASFDCSAAVRGFVVWRAFGELALGLDVAAGTGGSWKRACGGWEL